MMRQKTLQDKIQISIVFPVHNESGAAGLLIEETAHALKNMNFEIIVVDDCSKDDTLEIIKSCAKKYSNLRIIKHNKNAGQSAAIHSGVKFAKADIIGIMDGDGQNDPNDFPKLFAQLTRDDANPKLAMVQGMRVKRQDSFAKKFASRFANSVRQMALNDGTNDSGCGIKVIRRDVFLSLPYFDHMHRYMAALVKQAHNVCEFLEVNHRPRETGVSKYTNIARLAAALTDLFGVMWLATRRRDNGGAEEI